MPLGGLRDALSDVIGEESVAVSHLRYANTSVRFQAADGSGESVVLHLDRSPIEIADTGGEVGVDIGLDDEQAQLFTAGRLPLTTAIISGQVGARGDIRRYLEVDPILRSLLRERAGDSSHLRHEGGRLDAGDIDSDLLAVETINLHKRFGRNKVLRGLDVKIPEGTIAVVLGPSGTGKSVLLNHIIGTMKPDKGDTLIRGRKLSTMKRSDLLNLRREIGVMFQDGALFSAMNIYDNVAFPLRQHTDLSEAEIKEVVFGHLNSVGLGDVWTRMPNELSGGMRKRAGLARALAMNPGIVLCDEPDSGLDPVRTALLGELLIDQHAEQGGTMIVVTHNILLAKKIADHMTVVWRGKVLEAGLAEDVLNSDTEFVRQFLAGAAQGPLGMDA